MRRTRPVAVSQHPLSRGFHASRASHNAQLAQPGEAFEKTPAGLSCGSSCVTRAPRSPTAPLRGTSPPPLCVHGFVFGGPPIAKNDDAMVAAIHGTRNPNARAVVWRVAEACARVGMRRSVSCTRREDAHVVSRSISHAFRRRFMAMPFEAVGRDWTRRLHLHRIGRAARGLQSLCDGTRRGGCGARNLHVRRVGPDGARQVGTPTTGDGAQPCRAPTFTHFKVQSRQSAPRAPIAARRAVSGTRISLVPDSARETLSFNVTTYSPHDSGASADGFAAT